ncbi:MAG: hypothetical protein J5I94_09675, partial [Phaeodactylibacter sp.]|nr:hypothetical protein [Phaeodactylibacter sp.]
RALFPPYGVARQSRSSGYASSSRLVWRENNLALFSPYLMPKTLAIALAWLLSPVYSHAQPSFWEKTQGPPGGMIRMIEEGQNGELFILASGQFMHSTDNGASWSPLPFTDGHTPISITANSLGHIFAGSQEGGVFISGSQAGGWTQIGDLVGNFDGEEYPYAVNSMAMIGEDTLLVPGFDGLYRWVNGEAELTKTGNGLPGESFASAVYKIDDGSLRA